MNVARREPEWMRKPEWNGFLRHVRFCETERTQALRLTHSLQRIDEVCASIAHVRDPSQIVGQVLSVVATVLGFRRVAHYVHKPGAGCGTPLRLQAALETSRHNLPPAIGQACKRLYPVAGCASDLNAPVPDTLGWYVTAPVNCSNHADGLVFADAHALAEPDERIVGLIARLLAACAFALHTARALKDAHELAMRDDLTGLLNRRAFYAKLESVLRRTRSRDECCACALIDVDSLKTINDIAGHSIGDSVLVHLGRTLAAHAREPHFAARVGGDEFALVLDSVDSESARHAVRRVCRALAAEGLRCSVGVAVAEAPDQSVAALLRAADRALYAVKSAGKFGYAFA